MSRNFPGGKVVLGRGSSIHENLRPREEHSIFRQRGWAVWYAHLFGGAGAGACRQCHQ